METVRLPHVGPLAVAAGMLMAASAFLMACGGSSPTTETPQTARPASGTPLPFSTPSPVSRSDYDPDANMFRLFSGIEHNARTTLQALALARGHEDTSQVPVIIEFMRFMGSRTLVQEAAYTLEELTGETFFDAQGLPHWSGWMEWLGAHSAQYPPPPGYLRWKVNLLSTIDPRFGDFLSPGGTAARIDLTEVRWGGVRPDGIPDLRNPPLAGPDETGYLLPDDRVFGVSINGEHRAYPLRIVNAHEMVNDVLGGEPIALAY